MMQNDQNKSVMGGGIYLRDSEQQIRKNVQGVQEMFSSSYF